MPELPDIVLYLEALESRILNQRVERIQVASPFLLRTASPPLTSAISREVIELRRLGKRICIRLEGELWLVLHLMIAGRLHWHSQRVKPSRSRQAIFDFTQGTLSLTEAGTQRRASLHLVEGEEGLAKLDPGGLEVFAVDLDVFSRMLRSANHTLKRALTDPRMFSGIGNAYSDEILWAAQLSPIAMTQKLNDDEVERLFNSVRETLTLWTQRLRDDAGGDFPEKVTAFRAEMATHGKYGEPCPRCGAKIQRIRYAANETNYCPPCQTGGKLLADRALSRLLRSDWPRSAEELEGLTK